MECRPDPLRPCNAKVTAFAKRRFAIRIRLGRHHPPRHTPRKGISNMVRRAAPFLDLHRFLKPTER